MKNLWERAGKTGTVRQIGSGGIRSVEIGWPAHEAECRQNDRDTAFESVVDLGIEAIELGDRDEIAELYA